MNEQQHDARREVEDLWWTRDSIEALLGDRPDGDTIRIGVLRNLLETTAPETTTTHPRGMTADPLPGSDESGEGLNEAVFDAMEALGIEDATMTDARFIADNVRHFRAESAEAALATARRDADELQGSDKSGEGLREWDALREKRCAFCPIIEGDAPATLVERSERHIAFAPMGPHVPGHVLFVPTEHLPDATTNPVRAGAVFAEATRYVAEMGIEANIVTSVGPAATQSVPHLHVHVIPRGADDGLPARWPWITADRRESLAAAVEWQAALATARRDADELRDRLAAVEAAAELVVGEMNAVAYLTLRAALANPSAAQGEGEVAASDTCWCDGPDCGQTPCVEASE